VGHVGTSRPEASDLIDPLLSPIPFSLSPFSPSRASHLARSSAASRMAHSVFCLRFASFSNNQVVICSVGISHHKILSLLILVLFPLFRIRGILILERMRTGKRTHLTEKRFSRFSSKCVLRCGLCSDFVHVSSVRPLGTDLQRVRLGRCLFSFVAAQRGR